MIELTKFPDIGRAESFKRTLFIIDECRRNPLEPFESIVETGSLRVADEDHKIGDGWSTVAWSWYIQQNPDVRLTTLEINPAAVNEIIEAHDIMGIPYRGVFIPQDSIDSLMTSNLFPTPIRLLYCDSLGPDEPGIDDHMASIHQIGELSAYDHSGSPRTEVNFILLDDVPADLATGKCLYAPNYLRWAGYHLVFHNHDTTQMLWTNDPETAEKYGDK
jgi:hypothetical protein